MSEPQCIVKVGDNVKVVQQIIVCGSDSISHTADTAKALMKIYDPDTGKFVNVQTTIYQEPE